MATPGNITPVGGGALAVLNDPVFNVVAELQAVVDATDLAAATAAHSGGHPGLAHEAVMAAILAPHSAVHILVVGQA